MERGNEWQIAIGRKRGLRTQAVAPNAKSIDDTCIPGELLAFIKQKGHEVAEALAVLWNLSASSEPRQAGQN